MLLRHLGENLNHHILKHRFVSSDSSKSLVLDKKGLFRCKTPQLYTTRRYLTSALDISKRLSFDYNAKYFDSTPIRLEIDPVTSNRALYAKEALAGSLILLVTPYYAHVVHAHQQPHYCNACHNSLQMVGVAIPSKHIKTHLYCSEACRARSDSLDHAMAPALKLIQKGNPDFYVSHTDSIKLVLYALSRKLVESRPGRSRTAHSHVSTPSSDEQAYLERMGRPPVLKEKSLQYEDFDLLCYADISERNLFLEAKKRKELLEIDKTMRTLLVGSSLMTQLPLEILLREASNSFEIDKYDRRAPSPEQNIKTEESSGLAASIAANQDDKEKGSGYAVFPLASYFNHNCQPNCAIGFDMDANIVVRTTRMVEEGEELTICYDAGSLAPLKAEQTLKALRRRCKRLCRETWHFECDCEVL